MHHTYSHRTPPAQSAVCASAMAIVLEMKMDVRLSSVGMLVDVHVQEAHSQDDDHDGYAQFEKVRDSFRNDKTEAQYQKSSQQQGARVANAPKRTHNSRMPDRATFADYR